MSSNLENNNLGEETEMEISEKFKEIVRSNGINEPVSEVIVKDAGLKGEGFASLSQCVTVIFENSQVKPLNLFVKVHTTSVTHKQMVTEMKAFEKESMFFKYVDAAKEMCKQKGHEGFIDFYPKCYYGDPQMIVLENIVLDKGYEMVDMQVRQDLEEAKFAIRTLAKHHAIAHVMIEEAGGATKFFAKFVNLDFDYFESPMIIGMLEPTFDKAINSHVKMLQTSGIPGANKAINKLKSLLGKAMGLLKSTLKKPDDDSLMVLSHGDYWNNNMMFLRDKETNRIKHHLAIDFQTPFYCSVAIELGYYIYTSIQWRVRQTHLRDLLQLYLTTLNHVTEDFGHPKKLSFEELFLEFRKKIDFGFWLGFTMAVGPGMAVFKGVDISEFDMNDWAEICDRLLCKWIDENPDKTAEVAEEVVALLEEYEDLVLTDL